MKRISKLVLAGSLILGNVVNIPPFYVHARESEVSGVSNRNIVIQDSNLQAALNKILGQEASAPITQEQMESFTSLSLSNNNIENLEGLEHAVNLEYIDLSYNNISIVTPITKIQKLKTINLSMNRIIEIDGFNNNINLERLVLYGNLISSIPDLSNLQKLITLDLAYNSIRDISEIGKIDSLEYLDVSNNEISDFSVLSPLMVNNLFLLGLEQNILFEPLSFKENGPQVVPILFKAPNSEVVTPFNISNSGKFESSSSSILFELMDSTTVMYEVEIDVLEPSIYITAKISQPVVLDEAPVIEGADDTTIKVGDTFDPIAGVTATDKEDGTVNVVVTGSVDTSVAGKYTLTYTATDTVGNETVVTRIVTVNEKLVGMNNVPTITLENPNLIVKQDAIFDAKVWATATDVEDGDITSTIEVVSNTVEPSVSGEYEVVYKVTDSAGASTTETMNVYVDEKPVIEGADDTTIKVGDTFDPMAGVTATDKEDGTVNVVVTGSVDTSVAGKYILTYTATDTVGNETVVTRIVTVNEKLVGMNNVPTITLENPNLIVKQDTIFDAKAWATATDVEDGDLTSQIEVISNTVDTSVSGMYEVTYKVTDKQFASSTATMTVYVDEKPVIEGADDTTIKVGDTFDPMAGVTATDKEAGDLTSKIKIVGFVETTKAGTYELTYSVDDELEQSVPARKGTGNVVTVKRVIDVVESSTPKPGIPTTPEVGSGTTTTPNPSNPNALLPNTGATLTELSIASGGLMAAIGVMITYKTRKKKIK